MDDLVTIKTFTYPHEAYPVRSLLESEGIYCYLRDELSIQANPLYSNALGGVKLQVREGDRDHALSVLREHGYMEPALIHELYVENDTGIIWQCPGCGSEELGTMRRPSGSMFAIPFVLFGFPIPWFSIKYHCYNCGRDIKVVRKKQ